MIIDSVKPAHFYTIADFILRVYFPMIDYNFEDSIFDVLPQMFLYFRVRIYHFFNYERQLRSKLQMDTSDLCISMEEEEKVRFTIAQLEFFQISIYWFRSSKIAVELS